MDAHISVFANRLTPETINRISQERAIAAFADALSVWSRETHAEQWAAARMNLGTLYWQRVAGHRSDNRERAIAAFEDALSVLTRETNPEGWATAAMNLGIAYRVCAADEGSDRRDRAIEAFEGALSVWTRDSKPTVWAAARMQLGGAYLENSAGDRKGNLEQAIAALELTSLGILALTHSAIFNAQFWLLWVLTLPAVLLGSSAGVALYGRVRPRRARTPARPLQGTSPFH